MTDNGLQCFFIAPRDQESKILTNGYFTQGLDDQNRDQFTTCYQKFKWKQPFFHFDDDKETSFGVPYLLECYWNHREIFDQVMTERNFTNKSSDHCKNLKNIFDTHFKAFNHCGFFVQAHLSLEEAKKTLLQTKSNSQTLKVYQVSVPQKDLELLKEDAVCFQKSEMEKKNLVTKSSYRDHIVFVGRIPAQYIQKSQFICPQRWFACCDYLYFAMKQFKSGFVLTSTNYSAKRRFDRIVMASLIKVLAKLGLRPNGQPTYPDNQCVEILLSSKKKHDLSSLQNQINFCWNLSDVYQLARKKST